MIFSFRPGGALSRNRILFLDQFGRFHMGKHHIRVALQSLVIMARLDKLKIIRVPTAEWGLSSRRLFNPCIQRA